MIEEINNSENGISGKINNRITIALDDNTYNLLKELEQESVSSRSELIRTAIKFYHKFKNVFGSSNNGVETRLNTYLELLSHGEHIILDVDHYLSFLKFIENSSDKEKFSDINKSIGKAHAEEFSEGLEISTVQKVVERLEACNFFKIVQDSSNRYTLLLGSDIQKNFIKTFLEEVLSGMGFKIQIKEGFSKLKIILNNSSF
ncbi:MAG: CopG family transcriptional regulator [Promethearchaeota archaeon]|nr:MAG: CopG family transcriptional regulator [Candidatus Lokiarchaeota archaeon]